MGNKGVLIYLAGVLGILILVGVLILARRPSPAARIGDGVRNLYGASSAAPRRSWLGRGGPRGFDYGYEGAKETAASVVRRAPHGLADAKAVVKRFAQRDAQDDSFVWPLWEVDPIEGVESSATATLDAAANAWWDLLRSGKPDGLVVWPAGASIEIRGPVSSGEGAATRGPNMLFYVSNLLRLQGDSRTFQDEYKACTLLSLYVAERAEDGPFSVSSSREERLVADLLLELGSRMLDFHVAPKTGRPVPEGAVVLEEVVELVERRLAPTETEEFLRSSAEASPAAQLVLRGLTYRERLGMFDWPTVEIEPAGDARTAATLTLEALAEAWRQKGGGVQPGEGASARAAEEEDLHVEAFGEAVFDGKPPDEGRWNPDVANLLVGLANMLSASRGSGSVEMEGDACTLVSRYLGARREANEEAAKERIKENRQSGVDTSGAVVAGEFEDSRLVEKALAALGRRVQAWTSEDEPEALAEIVALVEAHEPPIPVAPELPEPASEDAGIPSATVEGWRFFYVTPFSRTPNEAWRSVGEFRLKPRATDRFIAEETVTVNRITPPGEKYALQHFNFAVHPGGEQVIVCDSVSQRLLLVNTKTRAMSWVFRRGGNVDPSRAAYSHDGKKLAFAAHVRLEQAAEGGIWDRYTLNVYDWSTSSFEEIADNVKWSWTGPVWSRDDSTIFYVSREDRLMRVDVATKAVTVFETNASVVDVVGASSAGVMYLTEEKGGSAARPFSLCLCQQDGSEMRLLGTFGHVEEWLMSSDGKFVYIYDDVRVKNPGIAEGVMTASAGRWFLDVEKEEWFRAEPLGYPTHVVRPSAWLVLTDEK